MEGMNAPMGSFGGYGHASRAVTVVDRSLRETEPGVYTGKLRIPVAGRYDVAFLVENPRILHCFEATALANPALHKGLGDLALDFVSPAVGRPVEAGAVPYRLRLSDPATAEARAGLRVTVEYYLTPGSQKRGAPARDLGDGIYEARLELDRPGIWYAFVEVPASPTRASGLPFRSFQVVDAGRAAAGRPGEDP